MSNRQPNKEQNHYSSKIKNVFVELSNYAFFHRPTGEKDQDSRFIGREEERNKLKSILTNSESKSGAYLITGFRGMGKTSVVNKVIADLKNSGSGMIARHRFFRIFLIIILFSFFNGLLIKQKKIFSEEMFKWETLSFEFVAIVIIPMILFLISIWVVNDFNLFRNDLDSSKYENIFDRISSKLIFFIKTCLNRTDEKAWKLFVKWILSGCFSIHNFFYYRNKQETINHTFHSIAQDYIMSTLIHFMALKLLWEKLCLGDYANVEGIGYHNKFVAYIFSYFFIMVFLSFYKYITDFKFRNLPIVRFFDKHPKRLFWVTFGIVITGLLFKIKISHFFSDVFMYYSIRLFWILLIFSFLITVLLSIEYIKNFASKYARRILLILLFTACVSVSWVVFNSDFVFKCKDSNNDAIYLKSILFIAIPLFLLCLNSLYEGIRKFISNSHILTIRINLGQDNLKEKDILSIIAKSIYEDYKKILRPFASSRRVLWNLTSFLIFYTLCVTFFYYNPTFSIINEIREDYGINELMPSQNIFINSDVNYKIDRQVLDIIEVHEKIREDFTIIDYSDLIYNLKSDNYYFIKEKYDSLDNNISFIDSITKIIEPIKIDSIKYTIKQNTDDTLKLLSEIDIFHKELKTLNLKNPDSIGSVLMQYDSIDTYVERDSLLNIFVESINSIKKLLSIQSNLYTEIQNKLTTKFDKNSTNQYYETNDTTFIEYSPYLTNNLRRLDYFIYITYTEFTHFLFDALVKPKGSNQDNDNNETKLLNNSFDLNKNFHFLAPRLDYFFVLFLILAWILFKGITRLRIFGIKHEMVLRELSNLVDSIDASREQSKSMGWQSKLTMAFGIKKVYSIAGAREIETRLIQILSLSEKIPHVRMRPKFIFIFDELDKIDSRDYSDETKEAENYVTEGSKKRQEVIGKILSNLKHFFNTAKAKFIFIAGREMYDAALADISDRDSLIGSLFHEVIYIKSFYKDPFDGKLGDITSMTEHYVCQFIIPHSYVNAEKERTFDLKTYRDYLDEYYALNNKQVTKLMLTLQSFITYLAFRSNGAPKKVTKIFEEYITSIADYDNEKIRQLKEDNFVVGKNKWNLYLNFAFYDQYIFGFSSYVFNPFLLAVSKYIRDYEDKLLVSTAFLLNHMYKYHGSGFSYRTLELTPEIIAINKAPELRNFINRLLQFLTKTHIREIITGLHQFKFNSRIEQEISFISKISEKESAAYNFTLDESLQLKRIYKYRLQKTRELRSGKEELNNHIDSVAYLNLILGDLYFQDQEYDEALIHYKEAALQIRNLKYGDFRLNKVVFYIRNELKLGLTYEKKRNYDDALMVYEYIKLQIIGFSKKFDTSKILPALRLIYQPFLAELQLIEKHAIKSITKQYLKEVDSEFLHLVSRLQPEQRFLIIAEYHDKVGDVLYYKNGLNFGNPIEKKTEENSTDDSTNKYSELIKLQENRIKKQYFAALPISAYEYYMRSLDTLVTFGILEDYKHEDILTLDKKDEQVKNQYKLKGEISSLSIDDNYKIGLNLKDGIIDTENSPNNGTELKYVKSKIFKIENHRKSEIILLCHLTKYLDNLTDKEFPAIRKSFLTAIGNTLSDISDCLLCFVEHPKKDDNGNIQEKNIANANVSHKIRTDNLMKLLNFYDETYKINKNQINKYDVKTAIENLTSLELTLRYIFITGRYFLKIDEHKEYVFQFVKILYILNVNFDKIDNPKELFTFIQNKMIPKALRNIYRSYENYDNIEIEKLVNIFSNIENEDDKNNIKKIMKTSSSASEDVKELLLLYKEFELKVYKHERKKEDTNLKPLTLEKSFVTPYLSINFKYNRLIELRHKAHFNYTYLQEQLKIRENNVDLNVDIYKEHKNSKLLIDKSLKEHNTFINEKKNVIQYFEEVEKVNMILSKENLYNEYELINSETDNSIILTGEEGRAGTYQKLPIDEIVNIIKIEIYQSNNEYLIDKVFENYVDTSKHQTISFYEKTDRNIIVHGGSQEYLLTEQGDEIEIINESESKKTFHKLSTNQINDLLNINLYKNNNFFLIDKALKDKVNSTIDPNLIWYYDSQKTNWKIYRNNYIVNANCSKFENGTNLKIKYLDNSEEIYQKQSKNEIIDLIEIWKDKSSKKWLINNFFKDKLRLSKDSSNKIQFFEKLSDDKIKISSEKIFCIKQLNTTNIYIEELKEQYVKLTINQVSLFIINNSEVKVEDKNELKDDHKHLILDSIFCYYEIIKSLNIYNISFLYNHSWLASSYYKLGYWCELYNNYKNSFLDDDEKRELEQRLEKLIGSVEAIDLDHNSIYERAISHYYYVVGTHNQGDAYKEIIEKMYYLDDSFNDNLYHFASALERYQLNNGKFIGNIDKLRKKLNVNNTDTDKSYGYDELKTDSFFTDKYFDE